MNKVQPIRDLQKVSEMKNYLRNKSMANQERRERNYFLFVLGVNVGIRISDIIGLRVRDLTGTHINITEKKTGKTKKYFLNTQLRAEIAAYTSGKDPDEFLFASKKEGHIDRIQAYRIINDAARAVGIEDEIGTHTLRKTFGYWHYRQFRDVAALQIIFNHSSPSDTLRYIGIEQDQIDEIAAEFYI